MLDPNITDSRAMVAVELAMERVSGTGQTLENALSNAFAFVDRCIALGTRMSQTETELDQAAEAPALEDKRREHVSLREPAKRPVPEQVRRK